MSAAFTTLKRSPVRRKRLGKPRRGPLRDTLYLMWIRTLPCLLCKPFKGSEAWGDLFPMPIEAHHAGERGLGQKADDRTAIPLCSGHHREGFASVHRLGKQFWSFHNLDREKIIADLNKRYEQEHAA